MRPMTGAVDRHPVEASAPRFGGVVVPAAWAALPVAIAAVIASVVVRDGRPWDPMRPSLIEDSGDVGAYLIIGVLVLMMLVIATRLMRREPGNSLARWMAVFALGGTVTVATDLTGPAMVDFTDQTAAGTIVGTVSFLGLTVTWYSLIVVLLRFPTGDRLGRAVWTRRTWWIAEWVGAVAVVLLALTSFHTGLFDDPEVWGTGDIGLRNPLGVAALDGLAEFGVVGWLLLIAATVAAVGSILVRAVGSAGDERNQLKWVGFGIAFGWGGAAVLTALVGDGPISILADDETAVAIVGWLETLVILVIPLSFVMAMFRYRLYDIDRVIRRTMVYGVVVAATLAVFGIGIALVGTAAGGTSDVGVAAATLAAAAVASPVHRWIRRLVDRRFNRRRAMSIEAVNEFTAIVGREIDETALADAAVRAVDTMVEPTSVSVWLTADQAR